MLLVTGVQGAGPLGLTANSPQVLDPVGPYLGGVRFMVIFTQTRRVCDEDTITVQGIRGLSIERPLLKSPAGRGSGGRAPSISRAY